MDIDYPPLPVNAAWAVSIIARNLAEDPNYLLDAPYPDDEIDLLLTALAIEEAETSSADPLDDVSPDVNIEEESGKLYNQLTQFSRELKTKDNNEIMSYFRTATQLLEKIVSIRERGANLKQVSLFHETVLSIMEDVLEPSQRTEAMQRLKNSIEQGS